MKNKMLTTIIIDQRLNVYFIVRYTDSCNKIYIPISLSGFPPKVTRLRLRKTRDKRTDHATNRRSTAASERQVGDT